MKQYSNFPSDEQLPPGIPPTAPSNLTQPHQGDSPSPSPDPRAWLEHIPAQRRSLVANFFHYAVRGGADTPPGVCTAVFKTVHNRLQSARDDGTRAFLQDVLSLLLSTQEAVLAYAGWVLAYEALPHAQRQRVNLARATEFLTQSMVGKEPTAPQLSFLRGLGYTGDEPKDRAEASAMIGRRLQQKRGG